MNRREFSQLLLMLVAAPALAPTAEAQAAASQPGAPPAAPPKLASGVYPMAEARSAPGATRVSHPYLFGMLPDNIRLEAHFTVQSPGAPPEPIGHHKHSEMWFVHEGACTLMTAGVSRSIKAGEMGLCIAGDDHYIANASKTEPASYFVVSAGPQE